MEKQFFSILLVPILCMSIIGCGNASAKDSGNTEPETTNVVTVETKSDTIPSIVSSNDISDTATTDVSSMFSQNYTGSLYNLPAGSENEAWTEAQLDTYLEKNHVLDSCLIEKKGVYKFYIDDLMTNCGFEYVDTFYQESYEEYIVYHKKAKGLQFIARYSDVNHLSIYIDDGTEQICIVMNGLYNSPLPENINVRSEHFIGPNDNGRANTKARLLHLKGIAATLDYLSNSDTIDCARLPYPSRYNLQLHPSQAFSLEKKLQFMPSDITFQDDIKVYQD